MKVLRARLYEAKLAEQQAELAAARSRAGRAPASGRRRSAPTTSPSGASPTTASSSPRTTSTSCSPGELDEFTAALQDDEKRRRLDAAAQPDAVGGDDAGSAGPTPAAAADAAECSWRAAGSADLLPHRRPHAMPGRAPSAAWAPLHARARRRAALPERAVEAEPRRTSARAWWPRRRAVTSAESRRASAVTRGECAGRSVALPGVRRPLARTSVRDALDSAVIALTAAGCDTPRLDAELLLAAAMGVDRAASSPTRARRSSPTPRAASRTSPRGGASASRSPTSSAEGVPAHRARGRPARADPAPGDRAPRRGGARPAARRARVRRRHGLGRHRAGAQARAARPRAWSARTQRGRARRGARQRARLGLDVELATATCSPASADRSTRWSPIRPTWRTAPSSRPTIVRYEPALALRAGADGLDVAPPADPGVGATGAPLVALEVGAGAGRRGGGPAARRRLRGRATRSATSPGSSAWSSVRAAARRLSAR